MQNTETFQTLQGLRTQPHKSPAKCTALLWIVTQFFLFMYGITAMIDAAQVLQSCGSACMPFFMLAVRTV